MHARVHACPYCRYVIRSPKTTDLRELLFEGHHHSAHDQQSHHHAYQHGHDHDHSVREAVAATASRLQYHLAPGTPATFEGALQGSSQVGACMQSVDVDGAPQGSWQMRLACCALGMNGAYLL